MKIKISTLLISFLIISICSAGPQFQERHVLTFSGGLKPISSASDATSNLSYNENFNFTGFVGYEYIFNNNISFNATLGILGASSDFQLAQLSSTSITYFLVGLRYYPNFLSSGESGRFYAGANIGGYVGVADIDPIKSYHMGPGTVENNEFGGQLTMGFDFILSERIKLGPMFSYFIIPDFDNFFGSYNNSGIAFSLNFGIMF